MESVPSAIDPGAGKQSDDFEILRSSKNSKKQNRENRK
jgi:hypothetical protein